MSETGRAHVIVVGNEKGGSGKSTTAMHLIVALLQLGRSVVSLDLDVRQRTLTRFFENRRSYCKIHALTLPMPNHLLVESSVQEVIDRFARHHDVIVIDTPGNNSRLSREGHTFADTLITPLNDSFVDLDVLATIDGENLGVSGPSHYAELVWEEKKKRVLRDKSSVDWIVMRNRLSSLDAHNKRLMEKLLRDLSARVGFRLIPGFGERVTYRELFLKGLTMMDLRQVSQLFELSISEIAARQEVRGLIESIRF